MFAPPFFFPLFFFLLVSGIVAHGPAQEVRLDDLRVDGERVQPGSGGPLGAARTRETRTDSIDMVAPEEGSILDEETWEVGDEVEAVFLDDDVYYPAVVTRVDSVNGLYDVKFHTYNNVQSNTEGWMIRALGSFVLEDPSEWDDEPDAPATPDNSLLFSLASGVQVMDVELGGKPFACVFRGSDAVTFLCHETKELSRQKACMQLQQLIVQKHVSRMLSGTNVFSDSDVILYKFSNPSLVRRGRQLRLVATDEKDLRKQLQEMPEQTIQAAAMRKPIMGSRNKSPIMGRRGLPSSGVALTSTVSSVSSRASSGDVPHSVARSSMSIGQTRPPLSRGTSETSLTLEGRKVQRRSVGSSLSRASGPLPPAKLPAETSSASPPSSGSPSPTSRTRQMRRVPEVTSAQSASTSSASPSFSPMVRSPRRLSEAAAAGTRVDSSAHRSDGSISMSNGSISMGRGSAGRGKPSLRCGSNPPSGRASAASPVRIRNVGRGGGRGTMIRKETNE